MKAKVRRTFSRAPLASNQKLALETRLSFQRCSLSDKVITCVLLGLRDFVRRHDSDIWLKELCEPTCTDGSKLMGLNKAEVPVGGLSPVESVTVHTEKTGTMNEDFYPEHSFKILKNIDTQSCDFSLPGNRDESGSSRVWTFAHHGCKRVTFETTR